MIFAHHILQTWAGSTACTPPVWTPTSQQARWQASPGWHPVGNSSDTFGKAGNWIILKTSLLDASHPIMTHICWWTTHREHGSSLVSVDRKTLAKWINRAPMACLDVSKNLGKTQFVRNIFSAIDFLTRLCCMSEKCLSARLCVKKSQSEQIVFSFKYIWLRECSGVGQDRRVGKKKNAVSPYPPRSPDSCGLPEPLHCKRKRRKSWSNQSRTALRRAKTMPSNSFFWPLRVSFLHSNSGERSNAMQTHHPGFILPHFASSRQTQHEQEPTVPLSCHLTRSENVTRHVKTGWDLLQMCFEHAHYTFLPSLVLWGCASSMSNIHRFLKRLSYSYLFQL